MNIPFVCIIAWVQSCKKKRVYFSANLWLADFDSWHLWANIQKCGSLWQVLPSPPPPSPFVPFIQVRTGPYCCYYWLDWMGENRFGAIWPKCVQCWVVWIPFDLTPWFCHAVCTWRMMTFWINWFFIHTLILHYNIVHVVILSTSKVSVMMLRLLNS